MIHSFLESLKFKRNQRVLQGKLLNGMGALAIALYCLTPQPTYASQAWASQDVGDTSRSKSIGEDEWVVFYEASLSAANSPNAGESFAIKSNDLSTGVQWFCGRVPNNPKEPRKKHCGSSVVWVKGDHSKNPSVRHRTSLTRYGIMCNDWEYSKDQYIAYSATGDLIAQWEKLGQLRAIIPGSFEERIARAHCKNPQ